MAYVPKDARWFLADLVLEFRIQDDARNVIHINTLLIRAKTPERAYLRATKLGRKAEKEYENSDGKTVRVIFRGLQDLKVIYEKLKHGAEIMYDERTALTERQVAKLVSSKEELGVFEYRKKPTRDEPNYMPKNIMDALRAAGFGVHPLK